MHLWFDLEQPNSAC